ncbi:hypothetical protein Sipo8835_15530 [Streptomyces ipomoeae]|uniref:Integral membrane protein, putatine family protein n=2 Tax=Streptomyces ipomoeae TaxID=103232 RepID=L1L1L3_9ACTN|nr:hypothetical protein [Streptomyces ipomoeae]EKX66689.1 integral membrane protein, putatine family protein [Streptomyces ipomoeae 91-03]MDX2698445.1 hypothetical protein [Streptomyces ipomoeae]MDX2844044.1 hypothetical protein [Streptomyces ipomoeae]TQE30912.1 hypothetical protein Sipo7851_26700 [Streptomyces ipomoeae]TQE34346.1 hypothetical protein Sipo8835_15530 [Streptomyces ipomoeae]
MLNALATKAQSVFLADNTVPDPQKNAPDELTSKVGDVLDLVAWAGTAAGVAGVLITGAMMAISMRRGEGSEHMGRLGMVLGGCVLVATAGPIVNFVF